MDVAIQSSMESTCSVHYYYCYYFEKKVQYDDGDQYAGEWNDAGKREGFGVLTFADGKCQSALIYKYIYINIL